MFFVADLHELTKHTSRICAAVRFFKHFLAVRLAQVASAKSCEVDQSTWIESKPL